MRRRSTTIGLGVILASLIVIPIGITPSAASWTDREYVSGGVTTIGALDCSAADQYDTQAWSRVLTGAVGAQPLDAVAGINGITVTNLDPSTTSTASGTTPAPASLGDNAWNAPLSLSALDLINVGGGVTLPLDTDTGVYTQYGKAVSTGKATGASGAVTNTGGVVSLTTPTSATPDLGTLTLGNILGPQLGPAVSQLADVSLRVGAVGALATLDACQSAWNGVVSVNRSYLVEDVALTFQSATLTNLYASLRTTIQNLDTTLDGLVNNVNIDTSTLALLDALLPGTGLSAKVGVKFDLAAAITALGQNYTKNGVTINLSTGRVSIDLATVANLGSLSTQSPNTSLLTPAVLGAISTGITSAVVGLIDGPVNTALTKAILDAAVTVDIDVTISVTLVITNYNVPVRIDLDGTLGGFLGSPGYAAPTASSVINSGIGAVDALVNAIVSPLLGQVAGTIVPSLNSTLLTPLLTNATGLVASTVSGLGATATTALTALNAPLNTLGTLLQVTLNAQPEKTGGVGKPKAGPAGEYFESALKVGIVNAAGTTSLLSLYIANASVGPNAWRR